MKTLPRLARRTGWAAVALAGLMWTAPPAGSQLPQPPQPAPGAPTEPATIEEASWLERLLFNTRERTQRGLAALEGDRPADALGSFRSAGRLAPADPLVQFNSGTAELTSRQGSPAGEPQAGGPNPLPSLTFAAENASGELAPLAHYNLGNAHLSLNDPAAAVEAFKNSLRADPSNPDAKVNLEIALRELEKQKQQQEQENQEPPENDDQEGEDEEEQQDQGQEPPPEPQNEQDEEEQGEDEQEQQPPDFEEQPDMTAEQAAAILEAVENLEREQRRQDAAERAREAAKQGKDW